MPENRNAGTGHRARTLFGYLLLIILFPTIGLSFWVYSNLRDRNPGYRADIKILHPVPSDLRAGFAAVRITPEVPDRWTDKNGDAQYNSRDGDIYRDGNGNHRFDPLWMAGFSRGRAANGIHDDLWARTLVIEDGKTRLALVVLDAIGLMHDEVIDIRRRIPKEAGVTYTIVASTHTHEGPDLLGLWGKTPLQSGVNKDYLEYVKDQASQSVVSAMKSMRPIRVQISEDTVGAIPLVTDTRKPEVFDSGLRLVRIVDHQNGMTLGSLIAWSDHPETLWDKNLLITSDFPHYVREGVEKGIFDDGSLKKAGIGGVAIYLNGAVGGLMTTHRKLPVKDPFTGKEWIQPSFEKAEVQGKQLALLALHAMDHPIEEFQSSGIALIVRTLILPIDNSLFRLATTLGVLSRGTVGWMKMRSELSAVTIGPISIATLPGEVYPEIINGGIEAPQGRDFTVEPLEVPSVREMMPGKYKFVIGLANDEIGYILPKSQWDRQAPYTYGRKDSPYGEENSLGPDTAPLLHRNLQEMLEELSAPQ